MCQSSCSESRDLPLHHEWVIDSLIKGVGPPPSVQAPQGPHVLISQGEVKDLHGGTSARTHLDNNDSPPTQERSEKDLGLKDVKINSESLTFVFSRM